MPKVVIYMKPTCSYCDRACQLLQQKGVDCQEIDITGNQTLFDKMKFLSHRITVPQVFIDDRHIGGCDDLHKLESNSELDPLLTV